MIKINIQILNHNGDELIDKQIQFTSLEAFGNNSSLAYDLMNEAQVNELVEGTFDSKQEHEMSLPDFSGVTQDR